MTNSIIVYRNPAEQAFWESDLPSTLAISLIGGLIIGVVFYHLSIIMMKLLFSDRTILLMGYKSPRVIEKATKIGFWAAMIAFFTIIYVVV